MGMYALIEDTRSQALDAANCWHETAEARAALEKIDAFERCSDRWYEFSGIAEAFVEAAKDAEDELDNLRCDAVNQAADAMINRIDDRQCDEWLDAWDEADSYAPPVKQVIRQARRNHAGDAYLERFAA